MRPASSGGRSDQKDEYAMSSDDGGVAGALAFFGQTPMIRSIAEVVTLYFIEEKYSYSI
jgi:hypothetical protein